MRPGTRASLSLMVVVATVLAMVAPVAQAQGPDELAGRLPRNIDGATLDAWSGDIAQWTERALPRPDDQAVTSLGETLTLWGLTPSDLPVAEGTASLDGVPGRVIAFGLPEMGASDLRPVVLALVSPGDVEWEWYTTEIAGREVDQLSPYGEPPTADWPVTWYDGEVLWVLSAGTPEALERIVTAVVPGPDVEPTPTTTPPPPTEPPSPSPPAMPEPPTPEPETTADLIMADVAAGTLDEATALLYRVQATFGSPALPERYAGLPPEEDIAALAIASRQLADLPSDIQDRIRPYLLRPSDPGSALHGSQLVAFAGHDGLARLTAADADCPANRWARLASAAVPVVVWARCDGADGTGGMAETLAMLEQLYPAETALMGEPTFDLGGPEAGGDRSIDVYLTSTSELVAGRPVTLVPDAGAITVSSPPYEGADGARASSAYVVMPRSQLRDPVWFRSTLAHELFHVLQYAHAMEGLHEGGKGHWFTEASAKWAEHHFVPEGRERMVYQGRIEGFQSRLAGLTSVAGYDEYQAWLWPYFMEQKKGPGAIADAWANLSDVSGWDDANFLISAIVPFRSEFREFAVRAWNDPLPAKGGGDAVDPRFQSHPDPNIPEIAPMPDKFASMELTPLAPGASPERESLSIDRLGMAYREYTLGDDVRWLTVDLTGLRHADDLDAEAMVHLPDGWERRELSDGRTDFCRDRKKDDFDRIILVLADHSDDQSVAGALSLEPREACADWVGSSTIHVTWDQEGFSGRSTARFEGGWYSVPDQGRCPAQHDQDLTDTPPTCQAFEPAGVVRWTWGSDRNAARTGGQSCHEVTSGVTPVDPDRGALFLAPDGEDHTRYSGDGGVMVPQVECLGWEGDPGPGGYFWIPAPDDGMPVAESFVGEHRPCGGLTYRFDREADSFSGSCWIDDYPGYQSWQEWEFRRVEKGPAGG